MSMKKSWGYNGVNNPYRLGSAFIKPASALGSPHAEEAAGRVFKILGIPGLYPKAATIRGKPATVSRYIPDLNPIATIRDKDIPVLGAWLRRHKFFAGNTALGEWLMNIGDRHGGNYVWHPTTGVMSIDHGDAMHPLNDWWPNQYRDGKLDPAAISAYDMGTEPRHWSVSPAPSALKHLHDAHLSMEMPVDQKLLDLVEAHTPGIQALGHTATQGLPEDQRRWADTALTTRLAALLKRPPADVNDLVRLTNYVRDSAKDFTS